MAGYSVDEAQARIRENPSEARKEYTRLRDIAEKRIKRMKGTAFEESKAYKDHSAGFQKLKDIDPRDLPKALSELSKFVGAKTSTLSGQKKAQAKTMGTLNQAIGASKGTGVTKENYWRVIKILNEARKLKKSYGSDKIVELANATMQLDSDDFDKVIENLETLLIHASEVQDKMQSYHVIHEGDSVEIDQFIEEAGWKLPNT